MASTTNAPLDQQLLDASKAANDALVVSLIQQQANVNAHDQTPLLKDEPPSQRTPLHWAAEKGHASACQLLLDNQADINAVDQYNSTPLHDAAEKGHASTCKMLIGNGADWTIRTNASSNKPNKTALELAMTRDVARTMQQAIDDVLHLIRASASGSESQVRELLDKGVNANVRSPSDGSTALLEAATGGHLSVCRMLLHRQADINACNNHNQSPLHAAGISGHSAVCKLLIDNHADVSIASNDQCTEAHHRNKTALECAKDAQVATIMQMAIEHTELVHTIDEMRALINQQAELIASLRKDHESLRQQFVEQPAAQQQRLLAHQLASGLRLANDMPPK